MIVLVTKDMINKTMYSVEELHTFFIIQYN